MKASARSAASYEDTPGRSIVALQKLSLQHDQELGELAGALTDFWLAPKSLKAVKAGLEAGADYMEEVKKRGRRHGLGAPYTHVAAAFVEALTAEAEGQPKQVLTTFMAHVAARQETVTDWSVQSEGGLINGGNSSSAAQGKGDDDVQLAGSDQQRGREGARECRTEGRLVRRALAQTLKAKGAEKGVGAGPKTELARTVEKQL